MSCPTVIRVSTKGGPPGIGLPAGSAQQDGFAIVKDGATPYLYKLVELNQLGLPQALGITASPTFAGLTLTDLQNQAQGLALVSTTGQLQRVSIGSGLDIQSGALIATATGGGSGTVTSVGLTAPTGFTVSGSPVTTNGTLTFNFETGYSLPTTAKQNQWDATTTALASHLQAADPHSIYTTEIEVNAIIAALTHLDISVTGAITQDIRNDSGATMAAGTPYHVVGAVGDTSRMRVVAARADDPATMPANGILQQTLTATGGGADGHGVVGGVATGFNTAGGTDGATIWVGLTGGISLTRPAANPQPIGTLSRVHATTGSVAVAIGPVLHPVSFSGAYGDLSGRPPEITQANAEEGAGTAFSLWSAQRWRQAAVAWWSSTTDKTKLDGIATGATANATDSQLRDRATHTGTQPASSITGLGSAAFSAATDFATPAALSAGLTAKADLVGGLIPTSQIPAIAISEYLGAVASQATMLALTGQRGDWCIRTDSGSSAGAWVLASEPASLLANWVQIPMPAVPVQSVNGQTGLVILGPGDVGAATAAQGALAATAIQPGDPALSNDREWSAATITQAEAEAGIATTRRAFTAERVRQAIAAWWLTASSAVGRAVVGAADQTAARSAIGAEVSGAASSVMSAHTSSATPVHSASQISGLLSVSDANPQNHAATAAAGTATSASRADHVHQFQPSDVVIPLSAPAGNVATGEAENLAWPRATILTAIPVWSVKTAPAGSAMQFDIRVGDTSIFNTLPTIAIGGTTSSATTPAVFSAAFVSGGQTIAAGSLVTFHVTQIGSSTPGAGLKVALPTRRAS